MIDFFDPNSRRTQAVLDRLRGKPRAVLDAIEALFFNRGNQLAVAHNGRRRVTVISVYAKDVHDSDNRRSIGNC